MKTLFTKALFIAAILLWGCGQKSHEHGHEHGAADDTTAEEGPNQVLYNEVMKIHDEVMPKMEDIYKLKEELKGKIASTPAMVEEKKKEIEAKISKLDSASEGMMVWMRHFNPPHDSLGEEKAKEYLELEMEKVKKVKEDVLEAIEQGKN